MVYVLDAWLTVFLYSKMRLLLVIPAEAGIQATGRPENGRLASRPYTCNARESSAVSQLWDNSIS
jgi:hypothetical protein